MSNYECLLSTVPSEEDLYIQQAIGDSLAAPIQQRSYEQEPPTREAPRPLTPTTSALGNHIANSVLFERCTHSPKYSLDIGKFHQGYNSAILGSWTPRKAQLNRSNHGTPANDGVDEDTPRASKDVFDSPSNAMFGSVTPRNRGQKRINHANLGAEEDTPRDPFTSSSNEMGNSSSFENTLHSTDSPYTEQLTAVLTQLYEQHNTPYGFAPDRPRPETAPGLYYKFPSGTVEESAGIDEASDVDLLFGEKPPSRPASLDTNNTVVHQRLGSQGSQRRHSASDQSDDDSVMISASEKKRRLPVLYEEIRRLDRENAHKDAQIEALKSERRKLKREAEKQAIESRNKAKKEDLALKQLKEAYEKERRLMQASKEQVAAFDPRTPAEKFESLLQDQNEQIRNERGERNWLGRRKGSKSDESTLVKKQEEKKGKLAKLFGGGKEKL